MPRIKVRVIIVDGVVWDILSDAPEDVDVIVYNVDTDSYEEDRLNAVVEENSGLEETGKILYCDAEDDEAKEGPK